MICKAFSYLFFFAFFERFKLGLLISGLNMLIAPFQRLKIMQNTSLFF